jgi:hypothetical protein
MIKTSLANLLFSNFRSFSANSEPCGRVLCLGLFLDSSRLATPHTKSILMQSGKEREAFEEREYTRLFLCAATLLARLVCVLKILTNYENGDQLHGQRRRLAVANERLHRVLSEAETDDGHLRRLQHQGGHPREQERRQRPEGVHEVRVLCA